VDSHRSYSPDEPDAQGNQPERGYSDPEWDRPGGDRRYAPTPAPAPAPAPTSGGATYGSPQTYDASAQQYGDNLAYRDFPAQAEPQGGYQPLDGQYPYAAEADSGAPRSADGGAAVLAMPVGPRSGEQLPPLPPAFVAEQAPPTFPFEAAAQPSAPPAFSFGSAGPTSAPPVPASAPPAYASAPPAYAPEAQAASGTIHGAPTSGLPYVAVDGTSQPAGHPSLAGDGRRGSGGAGWSGRDQAEETQVVRHATEAFDRAALHRPAGGGGQLGEGVYRSRRPGTAAAIVVATVLFELMALRLLASAFFASTVQVGGSIASSFLVLGMPMFGFGVYGLLSGAAGAPGAGLRVWLRPPLVYLPIALALFVTAGLAAA
jgi:hypothetical protein